mmetsp:Transcript_4820/g.5715  ORF Transcript_4820/g.5715 Transcript_4820/m.5715 type:complete len:148 (-) Transcript_4820:14-457(-)
MQAETVQTKCTSNIPKNSKSLENKRTIINDQIEPGTKHEDNNTKTREPSANFDYYKTVREDKDLSSASTHLSKYKKRVKTNVWNQTDQNLTHVFNPMILGVPAEIKKISTERTVYIQKPAKLIRRSSSKNQVKNSINGSISNRASGK